MTQLSRAGIVASVVPKKWCTEIKIHSLDDMKSLFPSDFCAMYSLVHSCVDMFI
jgi:hypothetical protein